MLKKSIKDYGYTNPIILDKNNIIIAGHARYKALLELGYENVECIITDLSEQKAKEFRIADNKIHDASEWNDDELTLEIKELNTEVLQTYFDDDLEARISDEMKQGYVGVNKEDIRDKQEELNDRFSDLEKKDNSSKVSVICPKCYEEFYINKDELKD